MKKYTDDKIKKMLEEYFKEVDANNLDGLSDKEYIAYVEQGHFRLIEDFRQIKDAPTEDVLFFISDLVSNYHVFLIKKGMLVEVHQEHDFRWCLTCDEMGEKSPYFDQAEAGESSAASDPF